MKKKDYYTDNIFVYTSHFKAPFVNNVIRMRYIDFVHSLKYGNQYRKIANFYSI